MHALLHSPLLPRRALILLAFTLTVCLWLPLAMPAGAQIPQPGDRPTPSVIPTQRTPLLLTPTPHPSATPGLTPGPGVLSPGDLLDPWAWLRGLFNQLGQFAQHAILGIMEVIVWPFRQIVAAWPHLAGQYDFITTTNPNHTYNSEVVTSACRVTTAIANAALGLLVLIAGYNLMWRQQLGLAPEPAATVLSRLVLAALAANTAGWWTARVIDLNNALIAAFSPGLLDELLRPANVQLTNAFGGLWLFLILMMAMTILFLLLVIQMLMRVVLINVLLVLAPLALVLLALPQTRGWAGLWSRLFTTTVFAQALQLIAIALATQLGSAIFGAGQPGVTLLAALATLYLTLKEGRHLRLFRLADKLPVPAH